IGDGDDYFVFSVNANSELEVQLTGLVSDIDLYLYDVNGANLASSALGGPANENIQYALTSGTYYVRVYAYSGSSEYALNIDVQGEGGNPGTDPAGNTLDQAYNMGTLNSLQLFDGWVGDADNVDFYRFTLNSSEDVTIDLYGLEGDLNLFLLDSNGSSINGTPYSGTSSEFISASLQAGTYYVQVTQATSGVNSNYTLDVGPANSGPPQGAVDMGAIFDPNFFSDQSLTNGEQAYSFSVTQNSYVYLTAWSADLDLIVTDAVGNLISDPIHDVRHNNRMEFGNLFSAGTYYVNVVSMNNYNIDGFELDVIPAVANDPAGSTFSTAYNLGSVQVLDSDATPPINGWVGVGTDSVDFYRVSTSATTRLNMYLTDLSADADVYLYNASGTLLEWSTKDYDDEDTTRANINPGTYYVEVRAYTGNTTYSLYVGSWSDLTSGELNITGNANMGQLGADTTTTRTGNYDGTADLYRFVLGGTTDVGFALSGIPDTDIFMRLYGSTGRMITESPGNSNDGGEFMFRNMSAGTYFLSVTSWEPEFDISDYTLDISTVTDYGGSSSTTAKGLGSLSAGQWLNSGSWTALNTTSDSYDWYRFVADQSIQGFTVAMDNMRSDIDLQLFSAGGALLASGNELDSKGNDVLTYIGGAGTYYVRTANASTNAQNRGSFHILGDGAGNIQSQAQQLGALANGLTSYNDYVDRFDTNDLFTFSLDNAADVSFDLFNIWGDLDLYLLDSAGNTLGGSSQLGTVPEYVEASLNAGTYYVQVTQNHPLASSSYQLDVNVFGAGNRTTNSYFAEEDFGNNDGQIQGFYWNDGLVGPANIESYNFVMPSGDNRGNIFVSGDGNWTTGQVEVQLLNGSGSELALFGNGASDYIGFAGALAAGTYTVNISTSGSETTTYSITLSNLPASYADSQGLASALDLGALDPSVNDLFSMVVGEVGTLGGSDTLDVFTFTLNSSMSINVALTDFLDDLDLQLRDMGGNIITSASVDNPAGVEYLTTSLSAGSYAIFVDGAGVTNNPFTNYSINIYGDLGDSDASGAFDAGSLGVGQYLLTNLIGNGDATDLIAFNLASTLDLSVMMSGGD
ncbi:MAG: hypothetical protein G8345_20780, partial [Magnetococcales bacterium]|nr:hypothetical protein [Magnetococcales bacterium]